MASHNFELTETIASGVTCDICHNPELHRKIVPVCQHEYIIYSETCLRVYNSGITRYMAIKRPSNSY